jgi:hypothetical protein
MDRAEKVRGREIGFFNSPEQAVGVDEIAGARRLGRRKPFDVCEIRAATSLGRLGLRERQKAEKPCAAARRQSPPHRWGIFNYSLTSLTEEMASLSISKLSTKE